MVRTFVEGLYELAARAARVAATVAPDTGSKLQRTLHARRGLRERYAAWSSHRDPARPLLWMHAPSVGEGLQARPVIEAIRRMHPDVQIAYTHFSPSAQHFASALDVDFHDYLPFDSADDARWAVASLRPTALVFSKLDVWPTLTHHASGKGVRLGLISATVAPQSARNRNPVRWMMRPVYQRLDLVGAVARDHADRLIEMGVRPEAVRVTGDTRHDQVWLRATSVDRTSALLRALQSDRLTLVAGSTWPTDEAVLLPAWKAALLQLPRARLIIAPHEPSPDHLAAVEGQLATLSLTSRRLSAPDEDADVLIVDRVGVLGDLYALGDVAYVGGGFHAAGLHSVLEPAAFGMPVIFGPRFSNSRDAEGLVEVGGGSVASSVDEMTQSLTRWLADASVRRSAGERARGLVKQGLGAAQRSADLVLELLGKTS